MKKQEYDKYTEEDKQVWELLFMRQSKIIKQLASNGFKKGIEKIGFKKERIPNFKQINTVLKHTTGWNITVVPGLIDNQTFFQLLKKRMFPATTWFRKLSQINYLEEPDMFHDVYGHVPLLTNKDFCAFLERLSDIALKYIHSERAIEIIARIYWFTVEFGLIKEGDVKKIYGAGILSSNGESQYCLQKGVTHMPYNPGVIAKYPYIKDHFQPQYFVIDSYKELFVSTPQIETVIAEHVK